MGTAAHFREWWEARRWRTALSRVVRGMFSRPGEARMGQPGVGGGARPKHPFDRKYGVDTDGLIYADADAAGHAGARHNAGYYATAPSLFRGAVELWKGTLRQNQSESASGKRGGGSPLPGGRGDSGDVASADANSGFAVAEMGYGVEDYALVDIGCGKGRVLMMAAEYPFRKIVGVELDAGLAGVARRNFSRLGRRRWLGLRGPRLRTSDLRRVRVVEGDALGVGEKSMNGGAERGIDEGPVVLFYFNSFELPMMEMWLARLGEIARGRTAPLDLIYVHPEFDALVRQVPGMRVVAEAEIAFSEEDAGADVFGVREDRCGIYRLKLR